MARGKLFTKGDTRINRRGSPRHFVCDSRSEASKSTPLALETLASMAASSRPSAIARVKAARELILAGWGLPPQALSVEQVQPPGPPPAPPSLKFVFVSK